MARVAESDGRLRATVDSKESFNKAKRFQMNRFISITEAVAEIDCVRGREEVCASLEGDFDAATATLQVTMKSWVRGGAPAFTQSNPAWLPPAETLEEHAGIEEGTTLAHDIFHSWVDKVRRSIPSPVFPTRAAAAPIQNS